MPAGLRRLLGRAGIAVLLAVAALVAAALIPGSHAGAARRPTARHSVVAARETPGGRALQTRVVGSALPASRYAAVASALENGVNAQGQYVDTLTPIHWQRIQRPVDAYRRYAERWAVRLGHSLTPLVGALRAGHRGAAQRAWLVSFDDYLHLGAVYGFLPTRLNDRLAEVPASTADTGFPGLHRLERGLWSGARPQSLVGVARAIVPAVVTLRRTLPGLWVGSYDYILRAHEIMEDAQRDLLSGAEVPWSGAGVSATAASLVAEREVLATLSGLLAGRDNTLGTADYWLARMGRALQSVRRPDGTYPTLGQLSITQRELLDATLAGTCNALSAVPGTLELHPTPTVPAIPTRR